MKKNIEVDERMTEAEVERALAGDTLDLSIRHFSRIENISHLTSLKTLNLSFNNLTSIAGLATLLQLQHLHLQHNMIQGMRGLEKNKNLRVVNLMSNRIEKIEGLTGLVRIQHLNLSSNRISKLEGIDSQKLVWLNLSNNLIESLDYISLAPKLEELLVANNQLSSVNAKVFKNCPKILKMDLSRNNLKKMKFVECLSSLEQLNMGHNQIESIDIETCLQYLQTLLLPNNKILQLPYLSNIFPQLMTFDISHNSLTSQSTLAQAITNLDSLTTLSFDNNPFYQKGCQQKYSKIFKIEVINGKEFFKAGEKYAGQIKEIVEEWKEFPELYMNDTGVDEEDLPEINKIRKAGFYDEDLEMLLIGEVTKRPNSPKGRYEINKERMKHHEQMFNEIEETSSKINFLKINFREILKKNGVQVSKSETFITNKEEEGEEEGKGSGGEQRKEKEKEKERGASNAKGRGKGQGQILAATMSLNEMNRITEAIKAERQASVQKWKQFKSKDKFWNKNLQNSRRKSELKEESVSGSTSNLNTPGNTNTRQKPNVSLPKITSRTEKPLSKMMKTTTNPFVATPIEKLSQTYQRPLSVKKV